MPRNIRRELAQSRAIRRRNKRILARAARRNALGDNGEDPVDPYPLVIGGFLVLAGGWWLFTNYASSER